MNPLTNIRNVNQMNDRELELGIAGTKTSWHMDYKDSAWIFVGGLPYDLTEGDVLTVFSQYGEIVNLNLVRDQKTGKSKGFCFICYEDQRSTILTVDNLNGMKILGRTLRVDHVKDYKPPKETGFEDEITQKVRAEGVAPRVPTQEESEEDEEVMEVKISIKKKKKKKDKKKKKKSKRKSSASESESANSDNDSPPSKKLHEDVRIKQEKEEPRIRIKQERDTDYISHSSGRDRGRDRRERNHSPVLVKKERDIKKEREDRYSYSDIVVKKERDLSPRRDYDRDGDRKKDRRDDDRQRGQDRDRNQERSRDRRNDKYRQ